MTLAIKTAAGMLAAAMTLMAAPALGAAEAPNESWQLRGQTRMRSGQGLSDPRTISGAVDLLQQAACRRSEVLLADAKPPRAEVEMVLFRQQGPLDETRTGVPEVDCDTRAMRTSGHRLQAWLTYPKAPGKYVRSKRMTVGAAVELAAKLANDIGARVLQSDEEAWFKIRIRTREKPVAGMIRGLARRYGLDISTAVNVARCESGLNPRAYAPPYAGVYQQHTGHWGSRARNYGHAGASPFDAYANVDVSLRMARAQGWRHWGCA
jgi:hypothetical protein